MEKEFTCTNCGIYNCANQKGNFPKSCLTTNENSKDVFEISKPLYQEDEENERIFRAAAEVEGEFYGKITRVEEIIQFAKKIGAKKIGIASCAGLIEENKIFAKILECNGFIPYGVLCKVGNWDKTELGLEENVKICPGGHESACNPIAQAKLCNQEKTDLNVISGLCVGHDSLFMKYSEAPVTYLVVKDRVLAHNPVGALNTSHSYYKRLLQKSE